jgi:uncharacterized Zn finger protein
VPVAQRQANALRQASKMAKKGQPTAPVTIAGRQIAGTFWGKAWCDNLEAYSDFENRLPRGRTYVRNGSVIDLQIAQGRVTALVNGSELYRISIDIKPLAKPLWRDLLSACAGQIDSIIELLQGRLSAAVMKIVTRRERGLFPTPKQIEMDCSCPDWAGMCKHVAATLYGVGARLDQKPELLFLLRGVDPADLIGNVSAAEAVQQAETPPTLADAELADVFGIEIEAQRPASTPGATPERAPAPAKPQRRRAARRAASEGQPASGKTLGLSKASRGGRARGTPASGSAPAPGPVPAPAATAASVSRRRKPGEGLRVLAAAAIKKTVAPRARRKSIAAN